MNNMEDLIEKAKQQYFDLLAEIDDINRRIKKPSLEELPELLGIKVEQWDKINGLFDGTFKNIYITIYQIYQQECDDAYVAIGQSVEVFDENNEYIRDLTDEEVRL